MKALSLFSGIGGLDLAAQACGIEPVAFCEIEPFPAEILKKRFPGVPVLPDVREVNGADYRGTVDVIYGGFPCQDLSIAGRKAGLIDGEGNVTRSGLWFEMLRIISEARPRFVVAENVRGAINAALDTVTRGLAGGGYEVRTVVIPASAFGAPHQRERIFIVGVRRDVADACGARLQGSECCGVDFKKERQSIYGAAAKCGDDGRSGVWRTPDANMTRGAISEEKYIEREKRGMPNALNYQAAHIERANGEEPRGQLNPAWVEQLMGYPDGWTDPDIGTPKPWQGWPARPGEAQFPFEYPRTVTGLPNRAKRLKALGNSVVPQQAS